MGRRRTPLILLAAAVLTSMVLLLVWQSRLTFLVDDWDLLLARRGFSADAFLDPHARHLIAGPAAIYKALQATIGMNHHIAYSLAAVATFLASVLAVFAYVQRRVGAWLALAAVLPLLFMGSAFMDLLSAFQICYSGSIALGIAALLAFERREPRADLVACLLLIASLAFAEIALAFAIGCLVAVALDRGPRRRVWVVVVPALLYSAWFLGWGNQGPSSFGFDHLANSPAYVMDGLASSLGSLLGLATPDLLGGTGGLNWGRPILVAVIAIALLAMRSKPPSRWVLVTLAIGLSFWFMTAANASLGRAPYASRYQYVGAVFLLMIAADFAAGRRAGRRIILAALAVSITATIANLSSLHEASGALAGQTPIIRGGLSGLEIAQDAVDPTLLLTSDNSDFYYLDQLRAGPYLSAERKFGSPAYTQAELASAPEQARVAADKVLAAALGLTFQPLSTSPPATGGCRTMERSGEAPPVVELPRGGATLIAPGGVRATLSLRRFATASFPIVVGTLEGAARLAIPTDRSSRPWQLQVDADGPVTVCPE